MQQQQPERARALLEAIEEPAYHGQRDELRGDLLRDEGRLEEAASAYDSALSAYQAQPQRQAIVEMKRSDLGIAAGADR